MIGDFIFDLVFTFGSCFISFIAGVAYLQNHLNKRGLMRGSEGAYHEPSTCNRCGGATTIRIKDHIEGTMCEAETTCRSCGFEDYWSYGFFQSSQEGYDLCCKYRGGQG